MDNFEYDKEVDTYTCPAGEVLTTNGHWYNKKLNNGRQSYQVKHYKTKACKACALRDKCTQNKLGRIIERTEYAEYVERNNTRVNANPDYYRQRQQIIEHQFGTLKRHRHFDYTLMRRKEHVLTEVYILFTLYNLSRVVSIQSPKGLIRLLKGLKKLFLRIWRLTSVTAAHIGSSPKTIIFLLSIKSPRLNDCI